MKLKFTFTFFCFFVVINGLFSQSAICSYKYRKRIKFDPTKVGAPASVTDLTSFPALISITSDNDLRTIVNSGHVSNTNGYDIVFTADDGVTLLNFQLESYTATTGQFMAWVNIPVLSTSINTYIYMYYGNAAISTDQSNTAVWSNYYGVWHLQNGSFTDNSGNGYLATNNSSTNQSPAFIGDGRALNGSSWLEVASTFPNITTNFTMSGWAYTTDNTKTGQRIFCDDVNNSGGYALSIGDPGTGSIRFYSRSSSPVSLDAPTGTLANNTWYYCVAVADITAGTKKIYINGAVVASGTFTGAWGTDAGNASFAGETASGETANRLSGRIDEVRVVKSALSSDWILTEYNNQNSPSTFYSITTEPRVWTGGTNTNWGTTTNWTPAAVPAANEDVIISNGTNQPTLDVAPNQLSSMWIQSGATLSLSSQTLSAKFDVTNCGTITGNTGTLTMNSTSTDIQSQYLSGSGTFNLNNLTVNNTFSPSPALRLLKDVNASGVLTLTSGITYTTTTNILALSSTATSTSGSASSFVSGPMSKDGTADFIFPVGKSANWRRVSVTGLSATSTFRAEYFNTAYTNTTSLTAPLTDVSVLEYWQLDRILGSANATVTLYWENANTSGINNCPDLTVAHWGGASWGEYAATTAGGSTCSGIGTGSVVTNAAASTFSPFTFGSKSLSINPLPIELLAFKATACNDQVCLDWSTATEINNDHFTVEKSKDGLNFETVSTVKGAGNSTSVLNYGSTDNTPYEGVSYYRLKQTDYNGAYTYSNLEMVDFKSTEELSFNVYPNPSEGEDINITLVAPQGQEVLVVDYDAIGKEIYTKVIVTKDREGAVYAIDPLNKLSPGMYLITAASDQNVYRKKIIVE